MIVDYLQQNDIQIEGQVEEYKTTIDPKNIEFLTTLLSTNLYSQPIESFIREIASNGWDSQVEAGTTHKPLIISFITVDENNLKISIRDYGTGLSPERFEDIFIKIGSSTKRDSNNYIGAFGIGRYSALACSNTVYFTSYYEGFKYSYIMLKSNNTITFNKVSCLPTTEENGLDVAIIVPKSYTYKYINALSQLYFFPNIYLNCVDIYTENMHINNLKIKEYNTFKAVNYAISANLLLGNVLYPVKNNYLSYEESNYLKKLRQSGIAIKFDIGALPVTPNREEIIYSDDVIKKIKQAIEAVQTEINDNINTFNTIDTTDVWQLIQNYKNFFYWRPIDNTLISEPYTMNVGPTYLIDQTVHHIKLTYKGTDYSKCSRFIKGLYSKVVLGLKAVVTPTNVYNKNAPYRYDKYKTLEHLANNKSAYMIDSEVKLTSVVKEYLKSFNSVFPVISELTTDISSAEFQNLFVKIINDVYDTYHINFNIQKADVVNKCKYILTEFLTWIKQKCTKLDFEDKSYKDFVTSYKLAKKSLLNAVDISIKEITISTYDLHSNNRRYFKGSKQLIEYLTYEHKKTLLIRQQDASLWLKVPIDQGYRIVQVNQNLEKQIMTLGLTNILDVKTYFRKNKWIPKIMCIYDIDSKCNFIDLTTVIYSIQDIVPSYFKGFFKEFNASMDRYSFYKEILVKYASLIKELNIQPDGSFDYYLRKITRMAIDYQKIINEKYLHYYEYHSFSSLIDDIQVLVLGLICKLKVFRLNYKFYKEYKSNIILNILCQH